MMRRLSAMALLLVIALPGLSALSQGTTAQDATPAVGSGELVDPALCQIAPRPAEEVFALWSREDEAGTPVAVPGNWFADTTLTAAPAPLGEPADAELVAAITATVRESYACANAGDFGRFVALVSDDMLGRAFGPTDGITLEQVRSFLAPGEPLAVPDRYRLVAITDVSIMDDGRVAALVVEDDPTEPPEGPETELLLFVEERGRWVVDGVLEFTDNDAIRSPEAAASPIAGAAPAATLPGVSGRSYRSSTFGYALSWDPSWAVESSTTANGQDRLSLSNGPVRASFHGLPAGAGTTLPADAAACLDTIVRGVTSDPRISDFGPAPVDVGTPIGVGENAASGVYVGDVTTVSGVTGAVVFFISCRSLGPDAVLVTTYAVPRAMTDEAEALLRELDASIELPDDIGRTVERPSSRHRSPSAA